MPSVPESSASTTDELRLEAAGWLRLQELYHLLDATEPERRTAVLEEATNDPALRERVLALLATASEPGNPPAPEQPPLAAGGRVGPYALQRLLGAGGLGTVYLTQRILGGAVQPCALKLLAMRPADPAFRARFAREQQILATLQHPNITHLLDAGFGDAGEPYLVMEFVDGLDLTQFCDERCLTLEQRVQLFLGICDAVIYAHSKLVVHLDLKPSNILVTAAGQVKLLDFGTSKLIESDYSSTTAVIATPAYASPEQLRGEPVTTSCDLYSLGTILYELLAGHRPFQTGSAAMAMQRAASEQEPARLTSAISIEAADKRGVPPARLRRMLRGDLASIVARCLRSRPQDRYSSVEALAGDLRRYLAGRPVLARRQTTSNLLAKFVRRHRAALAASFVVALLLATSGAFAAAREREALAQGRRAEQMQTFFAQLFSLANHNASGGTTTTIPEFLRLAARVLPESIAVPADRRAGELNLAESMYNNADYQDAQALLTRVVAEAKDARDLPIEAEAEAYAGMAAYRLGQSQQWQAPLAHALQLAHAKGVTPSARVRIETFYVLPRYETDVLTEDDVKLQRGAVEEAARAGVPENEYAFAALNLALALGQRGQLQEEEALAERALTIYRREPYAVCDAAGAAQVIGFLRQQTNNLLGSVDMMRLSYDGYRQCEGENGRDTLEAAGYLGLAMVPTKQTQQAIPLLESTLPKLKSVAGGDNVVLKAPMLALARSYLAEKRYADAARTAEELVAIVQGKINPKSAQMGAYQSVWARALAGERHYPEALAHAQLANAAYASDPSNLQAARDNAANTRQLVVDLEAQAKAHPGS